MNRAIHRPGRLRRLAAAALAGLAVSGAVPADSQKPEPAAQDPELPALSAGGVHLDPKAGLVAFPVAVEVRDDLLEYLVVAPHGAVHESMFVTWAGAEIVNAGLLAAGLESGKNAVWEAKVPAPSVEELREGASAYTVHVPSPGAVHPYVGWREAGDVYWFRVEDLVRDLGRMRTMRRHPWVFLGSRLVAPPSRPDETVFAATLEGNWINLPFFSSGSTLITSALPECERQDIWLPNAWLLPHRGAELLMVLSTKPLPAPTEALLERLPEVVDGVTVDPELLRGDGRRHVPEKQQVRPPAPAGDGDEKAASGDGKD